MIRSGAECSVLFLPLVLTWLSFSIEFMWLLVVLLKFVKGLAYVINLGAHLTTSKQMEQFPLYTQYRVLQNPAMLQCLTSWRRLQEVDCERVFWCVIQSCMTRPVSDVESVMGPDCFRFGSHVYHSISWQYHHPVLIPYSFLESFHFPGKVQLTQLLLHDHKQKRLQLCKHLLTIYVWPWCCEISESPLKVTNEKQMSSVVHMLTRSKKYYPQTHFSANDFSASQNKKQTEQLSFFIHSNDFHYPESLKLFIISCSCVGCCVWEKSNL